MDRLITDIERTLVDMGALVAELERFVVEEEARTRVTDVRHFAYSTAARAARMRSDNLKKTFAELKTKLQDLRGVSEGDRAALGARAPMGPSNASRPIAGNRPSQSVNAPISPGAPS
jgi:hypothetical protein